MRSGARLAVDWGKARIGVAACDAGAILAFPVETITQGEGAIARIVALAAEYQVIEIVFGLPRTLAGTESHAARALRDAAESLAGQAPVPVRLVDERMSTAAATRQLRAAGRSTRKQRAVIDQAAAVGILNSALELERATGAPAGELVVLR